jgi:hypothetical protein
MTEGQAYAVTVARKRARDVTYEGVYLGRDEGVSIFELESGVVLRVHDDVLANAEPVVG